MKTCKICNETKQFSEFYTNKSVYRPECKKCFIKVVQKNTKKKGRTMGDAETRKEYMKEYYKNNPEKFARYRANLRKRAPHYYRDYFRKRKNKPVESIEKVEKE